MVAVEGRSIFFIFTLFFFEFFLICYFENRVRVKGKAKGVGVGGC
jgi:hypothetical protein